MKLRLTSLRRAESAFTMIEIALCLAIIGFALVAIIGVLPIGMNTQRDTREETVINQDATMLLEAIRNGARGANDLTNYVYAITNTWTRFNANGTVNGSGQNGYTYNEVSLSAQPYPTTPYNAARLTNGANIIGLLSTPEFILNAPTNFPPAATLFNTVGYSNHVVAYIRSFSGLAAEKPPQDNPIMVGDTFSYRVLCYNAPVPFDTNIAFAGFNKQISGNEHEVRLTFLWPQRPNGSLGNGRQTFRATVAGQLAQDPTNRFLYFYQSQSYQPQP